MNTMHSSFAWVRSIVAATLVVTAAPSVTEAKEYIRGIYLSPYSAHQEWLLKRVEQAADRGDLNAVVVDMKDDWGILRYPSRNPIAKSRNAVRPIFDVDSFLVRMHAHNVRVIARLVCFKDEHACYHSDWAVHRSGGGIWADQGGAHWLNAFDEGTWAYLASIARELVEFGFDEIQLDYVRFPTDGDVGNCVFYGRKGRIKEEAIEGFLKMMRDSVAAPLAVDVFGYAAWRTLKLEGQELARIAPHVDYICPMLYPSHFSPRFLKGWKNREYWVYSQSVRSAYDLMGETDARVVTYVQGFSWGASGYGPDYIFDQMLASLNAGAQGFFIWNASGNYLPAFEALSWGGSSLRETDVLRSPGTRMKSIPLPEECELPPIPRTRTRCLGSILPIRPGGTRNGNRRE